MQRGDNDRARRQYIRHLFSEKSKSPIITNTWSENSNQGFENQLGLPCDKCNQKFPSQQDLLFHLQSLHPQECVKCNKKFQTHQHFHDHMRSVHPLDALVTQMDQSNKLKTPMITETTIGKSNQPL